MRRHSLAASSLRKSGAVGTPGSLAGSPPARSRRYVPRIRFVAEGVGAGPRLMRHRRVLWSRGHGASLLGRVESLETDSRNLTARKNESVDGQRRPRPRARRPPRRGRRRRLPDRRLSTCSRDAPLRRGRSEARGVRAALRRRENPAPLATRMNARLSGARGCTPQPWNPAPLGNGGSLRFSGVQGANSAPLAAPCAPEPAPLSCTPRRAS